jgi:hypothetical protein
MTIFSETMKIMREHKTRREFPDPFDARCRDGSLFPDFVPKFKLVFGAGLSVFTMGTCFSRTLEDALAPAGVALPALDYAPPADEVVRRPNEMLNDLNPGTIGQRLGAALAGTPDTDATLIRVGELVSDLSLPGHGLVTAARAVARRVEIFEVYTRLAGADVVVITLATNEAWFDKRTKSYMNRFPPLDFARNRPGRFEFLALDVVDIMPLLCRPIGALGEAGKKVVLTVSPAPVRQTYGPGDAICANEFGKSVLRVCAERLARTFDHVDYFPAYEIVRWAGLAGLDDNQIHVSNELARRICEWFIACYGAA